MDLLVAETDPLDARLKVVMLTPEGGRLFERVAAALQP